MVKNAQNISYSMNNYFPSSSKRKVSFFTRSKSFVSDRVAYAPTGPSTLPFYADFRGIMVLILGGSLGHGAHIWSKSGIC